MSAPREPFDLLTCHGVFLRRLAGAITSTDADADDLVQDTWVTALERPPAHADGPRGWLARAAQRLNGKRRRTETRREVREERAARPEAIEVRPDAALVLQEVVRAVVALEEPLRATVTARYFEDLSVREIARRHGVSVPTVKGRLRRARAELREALDDFADGDRRAWCLALASLGLGGPPRVLAPPDPATSVGSTSLSIPTFVAGALFMIVNAKAVAVATVALAVAIGLSWRSAEAEPEPLAPSAANATVAQQHESMSVAARGDEQRRAAGTEEVTEEPARRPNVPTATLLVVVTDLDGVPAPGVDVLAGPPTHPLDRVGETGADGTLEVRWPAKPGGSELVVGLRSSREWLGGLRRVRVGPGGKRRLVAAVDPLLLPSVAQNSGMRVGIEYTVHSAVRVSAQRSMSRLIDRSASTPEAGESRRRRPGPLQPDSREDPDGRVSFVSGGAQASVVAHGGGRYLTVAAVPTLDFAETAFEDGARVSGTVHDRLGVPASGVRVGVRGPGGAILATTRSGADGTFELSAPAKGVELNAGPLDDRGVRERIELSPGSEHRFDPRVDRGLVLRGTVSTRAGEPFEGGRIEATHALPDGLWIAVGVAGEQGEFELPHCPAPVISVDLAHPEICHGLPLARHDAVATGGERWPITVDVEARAEAQLVPLDEDVHGPLAGELRVWDAGGTRGARVALGGDAGSPVSASLPEGSWSLTVGAHGPHWSEAIPLLVTAGEPIDLGPIGFESGGWLELASPAEGETLAVVRVDRPNETTVLESLAPFEGEPLVLPLPTGRYRVESHAEGRAQIEHEVDVRAAQRSVIAGAIETSPTPRR
ncbi:MAG: sigma-70 family RNA polymerase sigma factor [bacterium]|nr:sigma-70 family RNA polymerase sigma factor [bacterium]